MEPGVGDDPATCGLQNRCSANVSYPGAVEPTAGFEPAICCLLNSSCSHWAKLAHFSVIGCTGWIRTSTYSINSRGEYPSRHGTLIVFKLVEEAGSCTGAFWLKRQAYYSYTISQKSVWPLRSVYVRARLMTERITAFRISPQVADQTFFTLYWSVASDLNWHYFPPQTECHNQVRRATEI